MCFSSAVKCVIHINDRHTSLIKRYKTIEFDLFPSSSSNILALNRTESYCVSEFRLWFWPIIYRLCIDFELMRLSKKNIFFEFQFKQNGFDWHRLLWIEFTNARASQIQIDDFARKLLQKRLTPCTLNLTPTPNPSAYVPLIIIMNDIDRMLIGKSNSVRDCNHIDFFPPSHFNCLRPFISIEYCLMIAASHPFSEYVTLWKTVVMAFQWINIFRPTTQKVRSLMLSSQNAFITTIWKLAI